MNHVTVDPPLVGSSRVEKLTLAGVVAPTRMPNPSLPLSAATYGSCSESNLTLRISRWVVVSVAMLSPVVESIPPGLASSASMSTVRSGAPLNAPATSANVVVESIVSGSW